MNQYHKKTGKIAVIKKGKHIGWLNEKTDEALAKKVHKKLKKGRVF